MSEACGCGDGTDDRTEEESGPARLWHVGEIRFAAVAAVLWAAGYGTGWAGGPEWGVLLGQTGALAVAGWTFVPSTLRRPARGRIGVGTLMTVAAVGAVLLGHGLFPGDEQGTQPQDACARLLVESVPGLGVLGRVDAGGVPSALVALGEEP
ncbi:hypothetical protein [Nocardiopsis xinjiangensis]|uniref:hypothetical protein n=1 Tax=Nocardiopsis xinjiangensis TaxID=124285 RepID=UPI000346E05C